MDGIFLKLLVSASKQGVWLSQQSVDFEEDLLESENKTAVEIAQELLKLPINRAFEGLAKVIED